MSATALDDLRARRASRAGVTARELLARGGLAAGYDSPLGPAGLERWLLAECLATIDQDGRLSPTERGRALGSALRSSD